MNSLAANMLDFDDSHIALGRPGATIVLPALVLSQKYGKSREELIEAVVAGYEFNIRWAKAAFIYVAKLVGPEHVGFGSDYVHDLEAAAALIVSNPQSWPKSMGYGEGKPEVAVPGVSWGVVRVLEAKYGWSEKELRGFLGENILRVYKANWEPAKSTFVSPEVPRT